MIPKKILYLSLLLAIGHTTGFSQFNLQHHYDIGRGIFTSTAEFLFHDQLGSTFGFTDINYDNIHYSKPGATDAYFELARYFKTPWLGGNLSGTVQYNDGVIFFPESDTTMFSAVNPTWLGGLSYFFPFERLSLSTDFLAKQEEGVEGLKYQVTFVWFYPFAQRFVFTGFLDLWNSGEDGTFILLTEPQLVFNHGKSSVGVELEISRNFPAAWTRNQAYKKNTLFLIPTIFVKYTFR